ncbi:hypothetical protein psal_cds_642 [Pandoravirus salinus]|uniref:Uncharacterized protein n=1 Tax=Pandoravirus salinus TaxID=1349410 RepID=S4W272_9VIRU|nr:hypothetical protein psal_cds_642 [Pandoravirus salinus]AGO84537.1 hypothetical protein psal_cds_642 [Pandoravirus salinus]
MRRATTSLAAFRPVGRHATRHSAGALQRRPSACRLPQCRPPESDAAAAAAVALLIGGGVTGAWLSVSTGDSRGSCGGMMFGAARRGFFGAATGAMGICPLFAFVLSPVCGVVAIPVCATLGWLSLGNIVKGDAGGRAYGGAYFG